MILWRVASATVPWQLGERIVMNQEERAQNERAKDERAESVATVGLREPVDLSSMISIEDQLALIIASAREVSIVGEELLREMMIGGSSSGDDVMRKMRHKVVLAPRLLAATQQQLSSLLAMLRNT